jgi:hypothetical protein
MNNINEAKAVPTRYNNELGKAITTHIKGAEVADKKKGEVARICFERKIPFTDLLLPKSHGHG